jgi:hypothetical protein
VSFIAWNNKIMWQNPAPSCSRSMSATRRTKVIPPDAAYDALLQWSYWHVFLLHRNYTAVGLSHVYWFYMTQVTLRCTSARTLVDLRRCGSVFLSNAFRALVFWFRDGGVYYAVTVSSTPPRTPGIDRFHILLWNCQCVSFILLQRKKVFT